MTDTTSIQAASDLYVQLDSVVPTGVQTMLAQFNATSGAYVNLISVVPLEYLDTERYAYVEVVIDVDAQKITGVLTNFKIVNIADSPTVVYETQINNLCKEKIYKRFQLEVQLDILRVAIAEIAEKVGIENEALLDMNDYIDSVKRANKVLKQSYIDNPDFEFISIEQEQAEQEAKLDGGLHEIMGPSNLVDSGLTLDQ